MSMSAISTNRRADRTVCMVKKPGYGGISALGYCVTIVTDAVASSITQEKPQSRFEHACRQIVIETSR
jgi:hypothetical protein